VDKKNLEAVKQHKIFCLDRLNIDVNLSVWFMYGSKNHTGFYEVFYE